LYSHHPSGIYGCAKWPSVKVVKACFVEVRVSEIELGASASRGKNKREMVVKK